MVSTNRIVNRRVNPLLADLPEFVERHTPQQVKAVDEIVRAFDDVDVVVLDAPTGSGKTLIGETVRRIMEAKGLYVCHSLSLQDQFARDYPYAKVVKGRSNYPTQLYGDGWPGVSCDDCTWTPDTPVCQWCDRKWLCPYEQAKVAGVGADLTVVNSAYALTEWNGPGRFAGRDLVVVDEADTLEGAVMGHVSVEIGERRMRRMGWRPPVKVTVSDSWLEWLAEYIPKVKGLVARCGEGDDKERRRLERLRVQMLVVQKQLLAGLPYAFTGRGLAVGFRPVFVGDYCTEALWKHGKKWLLMSATVISADALLNSLGWKRRRALVSLPSVFPVTNRPVVIKGVANMSRRTKEAEFERLAAEVHRLVADEPGRVVIHTVSYDLARDIRGSLSRRFGGDRTVVSYELAGDRTRAFAEYLRVAGSVLVAPSADRGIDLPDDLCRLTIIAKVPYPNLGDRMVSMRLHSGGEGQVWYTAETVRSIVQMAGRGVRHKEDWCRTVILDSQFQTGVWSRGRSMFPGWFREAIVWAR